MSNVLYIDTETFSREDIGDAGTYRYAEHAEIMLVTWAVNDGPVHIWDHSYGEPFPDLSYIVDRLDPWVVANNAMFDRNVLRLGDRRVDIPIEQWQCTMVQAMQHALPGALDKLGEILGLPADQQKQKRGKQLIQKFCKPAPRNHKADRYTRHTHPAEWEEFREYAIRDVEALREIHKRLPVWNWQPHDIERWHIDQRINDRGFNVDTELVEAGARAAVDEKVSLAKEFAELTGGLGPSQRQQVQSFLNREYGLGLDGTAKHIMQPLAEDESQPHAVRRIASIMLAANKTSTAKYAAMYHAVSTDGRFRGGLQFSGAGRTRRWAGRVFQPQNLPARGLPKPDMIDAYIVALKAGCHRYMFNDLMLYGAAALRGVVLSSAGRKLCVSDLSNIEGRIVAYIAGEEVKLKAFRDFDAGTGPDPYNVTVVSIIGGDPYNVPKALRNVFGKVPDLALGFEGGVGALDTFKKAYGIDRIDEYWPTMQSNMDPDVIEKARDNYARWGRERAAASGMDSSEWIACEAIKLTWRRRHPRTQRLWWDTKDAAIGAITSAPGTVFKAGPHLQFHCEYSNGSKWLLVRMPSGKYLTYFDPQVDADGGISYQGLGSEQPGKPRVWTRLHTYGGKFIENVAQSLAGDMLKEPMPDVEARDYRIILSVHDELITDAPDDADHDVEELARIMSTPPHWAPDIPLAADGFETYRYRKD